MVVERGAVRRSKILSLLCAESMWWNMKLICEGTMLAIVPLAYLHCSFQNCIMPYSTMVVRSPGRAECQAPQLFADFAGFPKKSTNDTGSFMW